MIPVSSKIKEYIDSIYGEDSAGKFIEFAKLEHAQHIRVNRLKISKEKLAANLFDDYGIKTREVPGVQNALEVTSGRETIGKTVEHIVGGFYIQSLSSMMPPLVLNPDEGDKVLDLCAAPGSKTTQLGELMNNSGTLIANEIQLDRVKTLVYNLDRMNLINTAVVHRKGELLSKIYSEYFDKILVDAPCSGLGIIQKKGEVSNWWSLKKAEGLAELQLRLLIAAIKMVKTGGTIIYSTCTLTAEENELVINKALEKYPVELLDVDLPVNHHEAFTAYRNTKLNSSMSKAKRIIPWEVDSEGFFAAKIKKIGATLSPEKLDAKPVELKLVDSNHKSIKEYFKELKETFGLNDETLSGYKYLFKGNDVYFVSSAWENSNLGLFERIGTRFGLIDKRNKLILHTQAAQILNRSINKNIYTLEDKEKLKTYLEGGLIKEELNYTGQAVIKYKDYMLGTAVVSPLGIKSRFPRAKRTQEIIYI